MSKRNALTSELYGTIGAIYSFLIIKSTSEILFGGAAVAAVLPIHTLWKVLSMVWKKIASFG